MTTAPSSSRSRARNAGERRHARALLAHWLRACLVATLFVAFEPAAGAELVDDADLSTPRRALVTFVDAANRGDWDTAVLLFDVSQNTSAAKRTRAVQLAQQLDYVLSQTLSFQLDDVSDDPQGKPEDGATSERVAAVHVGSRVLSIALSRTAFPPQRWVFSAGTIAHVPELYSARGQSALEPYVPPELRKETLGLERWQWGGIAIAVALALAVAYTVAFVGVRLGRRIVAGTRALWDDELLAAVHAPGRLLLSAVIFVPLVHALALPAAARLVCFRLAGTIGILAFAWMAVRIVRVISQLLERRAITAAAGATDAGLRIRGVQTQVRVLRRVVSVLIGVFGGAVLLMQFELVRSVGVSLLASAGVAGVVIGLAAQRTLGSLLGGIQLSITQPIRIGDDVIVENEFGTIEEITLTYVVVRIWDERRLIVPMTRFLEQPFQNWTKVSSQLHGTVMLHTDFSLPVDALRREVDRLLAGNPRWDGRTKAVHVTDANGRTLEVRILVSAANGGELFELRAELRERLVAWLAQNEEGRYLPHARIEDNKDPRVASVVAARVGAS